MPLSDAGAGEEVTILRVTEEAEEDARLLTFLQEHDVRPGSVFAVEEVAEHIGTMTMRGPRGEVTLGLSAAAKLRALPGRATRGCSTGCRSARGWPPRPVDLLASAQMGTKRSTRVVIASVATVLWLGYMVVGLWLINTYLPTVRGEGPAGLAAFVGLVGGVVWSGLVMWAASD
jgi:hypothetical protein